MHMADASQATVIRGRRGLVDMVSAKRPGGQWFDPHCESVPRKTRSTVSTHEKDLIVCQ